MSCSKYYIVFSLLSLSLFASEPKQFVQPKRLACILDRNSFGIVPTTTLQESMYGLDATMAMCGKCIIEKLPILVNVHVLRSILRTSELPISSAASYQFLDQTRALLPQDARNLASHFPDISRALYWTPLDSEIQHSKKPSDLQQHYKLIEDIKQNYHLYETKHPNLQLVLMLPKQEKDSPEELLIDHCFDTKKFNYIDQTKCYLRAFLNQCYFSPDEAEHINSPLDIEAFGSLFSEMHKIPRHVLLFGHGNIGTIAQIPVENIRSFFSVMASIGCSSLSIDSCYAGAIMNMQACFSAYFPVIIFSIGNMVSNTIISFDRKDAQPQFCSIATYWNGLDAYLQYQDPQSSEAINCLCKAVEAIHVNDPHNFPWIYFPYKLKPVHLSELMAPTISRPIAKAASAHPFGLCPASDPDRVPTQTAPVQPKELSLTPTVINDETGIITTAINAQAQEFRIPIILDSKKTLLLHLEQVTAPVIIHATVPMIISMTTKSIHGFEHVDIGRLYLNTFLYELLATKKTMLIKKLLCSNYQDSHIARNVSGEPLALEQLLVAPLSMDQLLQFGRAYFKTSHGKWYKLDIICNDASKDVARLDSSQAQIESEYINLMEQLCKSTAPRSISNWLKQILTAFKKQDTIVSTAQKRKAVQPPEGIPDQKYKRFEE